MWTRFTFEDIRIIAHYLGTLTSLFTVALLIPLITALVFQEWEPATRYFLAAGISLTIGSLLRMAKVDPGRLTRQQALALTGFAWMAVLTDRFRVPDILGRTVIVHSQPDDFTTQPSGNAGAKIACGVITPTRR